MGNRTPGDKPNSPSTSAMLSGGPKWSRLPYREDPDYTKPLLAIRAEARERMYAKLRFLYGEDRAAEAMPELERIIRVHHAHKSEELLEAEKDFDLSERFSQKDMVLITYGDMVEGDEILLTMTNVANRAVDPEISEIGVKADRWVDLVNEREYRTESGKLSLVLEPYDVVWMKAFPR